MSACFCLASRRARRAAASLFFFRAAFSSGVNSASSTISAQLLAAMTWSPPSPPPRWSRASRRGFASSSCMPSSATVRITDSAPSASREPKVM